MMRTTLAYIFTALVVVCPYFCLGSIAKDADTHAPICSCCESRERDGDECPDDSDTGEPDCLCHGAILTRVVCPDSPTDNFCVHMTISSLADTQLSCTSGSAPDDFLSPNFPPYFSGREICALNCVQLL